MLRAYLSATAACSTRVGIGPRGGGLRRIQRVLDDCFFSGPEGPTPTGGPDLDVEVVVRWLSANRDRVVAFDPTELRSSREVIERLEWFLSRAARSTPTAVPIHSR